MQIISRLHLLMQHLNIRSFVYLLCVLTIITTQVGCASSFDRVAITKLVPIRTDGEAQIFLYEAFADAMYPLESEAAEKTRIEWLEIWLQDNGYNTSNYQIISRKPILRQNVVYDVYYEVRAFK